jgi:hypothetical protein
MSEARAWGMSLDAFCLSVDDNTRQRGKRSTNYREMFLQVRGGDDYPRPPMLSGRLRVFSNFYLWLYEEYIDIQYSYSA